MNEALIALNYVVRCFILKNEIRGDYDDDDDDDDEDVRVDKQPVGRYRDNTSARDNKWKQ